jgi:hypothetical protein
MNHRLSITTAALLITVSLPAFAQTGGPMKGVREYALAALAALGVVLLSMFVMALVRGRRRRMAELAHPAQPIDISKRHIILSRAAPAAAAREDEADTDLLPEVPPPASIREPIVPAPIAHAPLVAESRTPTVPSSQPRPASKPQSDLAAAMLRATAPPPPPPPASQRQWLSQRPAAMAKDSR